MILEEIKQWKYYYGDPDNESYNESLKYFNVAIEMEGVVIFEGDINEYRLSRLKKLSQSRMSSTIIMWDELEEPIMIFRAGEVWRCDKILGIKNLRKKRR